MQLRQLKTLIGVGLINFNKFFLKTLRLVALPRLGSSLFHSITGCKKRIFEFHSITGWKKRIFEKVMFSIK